MTDSTQLPIDRTSHDTLATTGLDYRLLDVTDADAARAWLLAETRGFHDGARSDALIEAQTRDMAGDRVIGVWDSSALDAGSPLATVRSWIMDLTVPGGAALPAWAISDVTVAPTYRRRGVARALLTAELRTARDAGISMAMLTVSEATIYSRYGFGPAAWQAHYAIDTRRAHWRGPTPAGRLQLVAPASLLGEAPAVFARARRVSPGEVDRRTDLWQRIVGVYPAKPQDDKRDDLYAVRYDDETGTLQGFAVYRFVHENAAFPNRLEVTDLVAATDDAYAALWRILVEMDLTDDITAPMRAVNEPLSWMVADRRAVQKTDERDHLWLRILDVPATLERRTYASPGEFVLTVEDDLGFIDGEYLLTVDADGRGTAHPLAESDTDPSSAAARLTLTAADLASLYLGGASAVDLAGSARLTEQTTDAAARLDATFRSAHPPRLSTWF
ncbi:GNAT family N-acetyltransferase [Glaciibacter superstes]|uniref:GNAT family N-acetyltransferase n=1 Tax=Glaciibacter superstes TaxID=501023 RepID=UPI0003B404BE|nr:GNAT family N-acetyltransferase [Glaciibacter superstes]